MRQAASAGWAAWKGDFDHEMTLQEKKHSDITAVQEVATGQSRSSLLTAAQRTDGRGQPQRPRDRRRARPVPQHRPSTRPRRQPGRAAGQRQHRAAGQHPRRARALPARAVETPTAPAPPCSDARSAAGLHGQLPAGPRLPRPLPRNRGHPCISPGTTQGQGRDRLDRRSGLAGSPTPTAPAWTPSSRLLPSWQRSRPASAPSPLS